MKYLIILAIIFAASCTSHPDQQKNNHGSASADSAKTIAQAEAETEVMETFTDSINIAVKGRSKIEIIKHRVNDDAYLIIRFYTNGPKHWLIQNTYLYETNSLMDLDPDISDFNNDGLNDITFISASAARGANEVRRLFIYDDLKQELVSIVNSQDYPNMEYNKELDCIDAFAIYSGSSTMFARIYSDSLIEFARVDNDGESRSVYETDEDGNEKLLREDPLNMDDLYTRYKNYKPLKAYGE